MAVAPPPPYNGAAYPDLKDQPMIGQPIATGQPVIVAGPLYFGNYATSCMCPRCRQQIVTRVEKKAGVLSWIICFILFFTFLWPCCWIPFCVDACRDTEHYCPNCGSFLGAKKHI